MAGRRKFLVIDDNAEGRFLLAKTLLRKFPRAQVHECDELETALQFVRGLRGNIANLVVIAHRAGDVDGPALVSALRREHATIPIVWISGLDRSHQLSETGATRFLSYDAWLMIGSTVEALDEASATPAARSLES